MVLDKAQAIKSASSICLKKLLSFNRRDRLLSTGNPIQNTLGAWCSPCMQAASWRCGGMEYDGCALSACNGRWLLVVLATFPLQAFAAIMDQMFLMGL